MRLWRIAGAAHPVWSGEGARIYGARWNPPGVPAIYTGTSYAIAMLETLVHANMSVPPRRLLYVHADVDDAAVERGRGFGVAGGAGFRGRMAEGAAQPGSSSAVCGDGWPGLERSAEPRAS